MLAQINELLRRGRRDFIKLLLTCSLLTLTAQILARQEPFYINSIAEEVSVVLYQWSVATHAFHSMAHSTQRIAYLVYRFCSLL